MGTETPLIIPFFNRRIKVSPQGLTAIGNEPVSPAVAGLLTRYLAGVPDPPPPETDKWLTFREFSGAGPLFSRFTANTAKTLEQTFGSAPDALAKRCLALGAEPLEIQGFALGMAFTALPGIPVRLLFNETDDSMPAAASFLYMDTAIRYLDLKDLMSTCTWLTGMLIR